MKNPYVQITDQEQYKSQFVEFLQKILIFLIERPTAGEIIALWWTTSSVANQLINIYQNISSVSIE